jgi:hypothetical protein
MQVRAPRSHVQPRFSRLDRVGWAAAREDGMDLDDVNTAGSPPWVVIAIGAAIILWGIVELFLRSATFTQGRWLYIVHRDTSPAFYWIAVAMKGIVGVVVIVGAFAVPAITGKKSLAAKGADTDAGAPVVTVSAAAAAVVPPPSPPPRHTAAAASAPPTASGGAAKGPAKPPKPATK